MLLERLRVVADLPWTARASERVDIEAAMAELEAAHAGRAALKARIRRFLATRRLTSTTWTVEGRSHGDRSRRGDGSAPVALRRLVVRPARSATRTPILCFAGPPGGGKTTLAMLIARALRRPGVIVALGGVWDESAIRGLPISFRSPEAGRIVLGLQEARVRNPVMILDEIDKVGGGATTNFGDPSAALLEVLDPAQNTHFRDAYVEAPIDLSEVLFIATANDLAKIPAPLRDRLEIIEAPGYTDDEKVDIVRRTLWREQLEVSGLSAGGFWTRSPAATPRERPEEASGASPARRRLTVEVLDGAQAAMTPPVAAPEANPSGPLTAGGVEVTDAAIRAVVRGHTCEAGVRHLARELGAICQFVACRRVETGDAAPVTVVADADEAVRLEPTGSTSAWPRSWDRRGTTRCPRGMRSPGSAAASWASIRRTPRPSLRRRGSRCWRNCRGRGRRSGSTRRRGCGRGLTGNTSAAPGKRTRCSTTWWPVRPSQTEARPAPTPAAGLYGFPWPASRSRRRFSGIGRPAPDAAPGRSSMPGSGSAPCPATPATTRWSFSASSTGWARRPTRCSACSTPRATTASATATSACRWISAVLFVAVATDPGRIPPLLQERLEALPLAGYTDA